MTHYGPPFCPHHTSDGCHTQVFSKDGLKKSLVGLQMDLVGVSMQNLWGVGGIEEGRDKWMFEGCSPDLHVATVMNFLKIKPFHRGLERFTHIFKVLGAGSRSKF